MWHNGWHAGHGWGMVFMGLIVVAAAVAIVWLIVAAVRRKGPTPPPSETPEHILRERYARGEISEEEFERRMRKLREQ